MSGPGGIGGLGPMGQDPFATLESLRSGKIDGRENRLKASADLMESAFFQELFKALRATVPESGLLDGGSGEDVFSSLMDQHLADVAASRLDRGLGEALYRRLAGIPGTGGGEPQDSGGGADPMKVEKSLPTTDGSAG